MSGKSPGKEEECLLAYRTKGECWGKEQTVIAFVKNAKQDRQYTDENGFKFCVDLYLEAYKNTP